jgi:outer membrane protein assembly factor BamB
MSPDSSDCARWVARGFLRRAGLALLAAAGLAGGAAAQTVPTYHGSADRSGLYVTPSLSWTTAANVAPDTGFSGTISGNVYAQPLYWLPQGASTGQIIVATESNTVYSLAATTGATLWETALGRPVTGGLPCGDINPLGVTGTPVIDPNGTGTLYLDAMVQESLGPKHKIFAISLATGKVLSGWPIDVKTGINELDHAFTVPVQGQRSALSIVAEQLFVPYGGMGGDCFLNTGNGLTHPYRGIVVQVSLGIPRIGALWHTRAERGGIWSQGGIAYDGAAMFVTTGNTSTSGNHSWGDGEAVIRLLPGLAHEVTPANYFAPSNWLDLDNGDIDLGGTGPIPVDVPGPNGTTLAELVQLGKDGNAYLLSRTNLGGIGGQLAMAHVSTDQIRTAPARFPTATAAMVAFTGSGAACPTGQSGSLTMLQITDSTTAPISTAWCANPAGGGAPIVTTTDGQTDPIVWAVDTHGGELRGFRGTDGAELYAGGSLSGLQSWVTILAAEGRFYVAGTNRVFAFAW